MVTNIQITSWKLCSDGLTLSADSSVSRADLSQAKTMITQWCDFFMGRKCRVLQGSFIHWREDNKDRRDAEVS